ncbi:hypothetical protein M0802_001775 [Mischocyttarus mexicanus]|nr:hypothetical protein M0802_001775 [Mischocyttarus mexicanus]
MNVSSFAKPFVAVLHSPSLTGTRILPTVFDRRRHCAGAICQSIIQNSRQTITLTLSLTLTTTTTTTAITIAITITITIVAGSYLS